MLRGIIKSNFLFLFFSFFFLFVLVFETGSHPLALTGLNVIAFLLSQLPSTGIRGMSHRVCHNFLSNKGVILSLPYSRPPLIQTPWRKLTCFTYSLRSSPSLSPQCHWHINPLPVYSSDLLSFCPRLILPQVLTYTCRNDPAKPWIWPSRVLFTTISLAPLSLRLLLPETSNN